MPFFENEANKKNHLNIIKKKSFILNGNRNHLLKITGEKKINNPKKKEEIFNNTKNLISSNPKHSYSEPEFFFDHSHVE